jgi:hypothetical protein
MQCLLHFPVAATVSMEYGKAIHETLEWIDIYNKQHTGVPSLQQAKQQFKKNIQHKRLETNELSLLIERATVSLKAYLQQRASTIDANNYAEYNFRDEGVFIGDAHLSGKIDKLIVNRTNKTITIVDYKTGKSHARWERDARLHFYRYQLYFYKLLVERSHTFHGYSVNDAYLEFIDPDSEGHIQELHILFDAEELAKLESLIERVWHHVLALDFPNTNDYTADLSGIEDFENDLLEHHL